MSGLLHTAYRPVVLLYYAALLESIYLMLLSLCACIAAIITTECLDPPAAARFLISYPQTIGLTLNSGAHSVGYLVLAMLINFSCEFSRGDALPLITLLV